ncbi:MAG: hypothetical protein M1818_002553 [Claussenomyces sp. TS43310]|nr:MAG: hypothetical protein M1818_002553 [Claussenomyces sp. TS43310]
MDSPFDDSSEVYTSAAELLEEIEFQKVLLRSLDNTIDDKESTETEIKAEIRGLERQLRTLKEKQQKQTIRSSSHAFPNHRASPTALPFADEDPFRSFSQGAVMGSIGGIPSTISTSGSAASAAGKGLLSPSQLDLPTRKRSYNDPSGSAAFSDHTTKSRRTTPSPQNRASRVSSPSSVTDGQHENLLAQRQRLIEERIQRERQDEEYARRLQEEMLRSASSSSRSSQGQAAVPTPSGSQTAYDRLLGRPNGSRPPPSSTREYPSRPSQTPHQQASAASFHSVPSAPPIRFKPEHPNAPPAPRFSMPGSFNSYDSEGDSDMEIIEPDAFMDNGRHQSSALRQPPAPSFSVYPPYPQPAKPFHDHHIPDHTRHHRQAVSPADAAARARQAAARKVLDSRIGLGSRIDASPMRNILPSPTMHILSRPGPLRNGFVPSQDANVCGNSQTFGNYLSHTGPSSNGHAGHGSSNGDPLSKIIAQTSSYNYDSMTDIYGNPLDPRVAMDVHDFITDPRKTAQEIKDLLENIRPDTEIPIENREGTPDGLKYPLYEHQKLALTWLKSMEDGTNKGGILADDMGLGKTISALALILSRPSDDRARKTTLIIGPVALIRQWEREIKTKTKADHSLSTFVFHSGKKASWDKLRTFDVVLTTYGTLGAEYGRLEAWAKSHKDNPTMIPSDESKMFPFLGKSSKWYRVILDEAQCIKNKKTKAALAASSLQSITRFCLTGTPMMNGVHELFSLIHFLQIKPYNSSMRFNQDFNCLSRTAGSTSKREKEAAMRKLQAVLKAIMLRRTKSSKIDGKPILTLPSKTEEIVHVLFNEDEHAYYSALESRTQLQFNKYLKAGTVGKNYSNILVLLLRLRQAACHPHLIMDFEEAPADSTPESMMELAKTLTPDVVARIIQATIPFECPVCYDPVPNPRIVVPCGHDTCSECLVRITATQAQQGLADGNEAAAAKCPTCRGKIDPQKIIDYETFKTVHLADKTMAVVDSDDSSTADDCDSDSDMETEDSSDDDIDEADLDDFVVPDNCLSEDEAKEDGTDGLDIVGPQGNDEGGNEGETNVKGESSVKYERKISKAESEEEDSDELPEIGDIQNLPASGLKKRPPTKMVKTASIFKTSKKPKILNGKRSKKSKRGDRKGKGKAKEIQLSLAMLKKEALKSAANRRRYMKHLKEHWVSSAKTDKCMDLLRQTLPDVKTIIFSQFTTLLDLIEVPILREMGRTYVRYDGSMSAEARNNAVVSFTDDPNCRIMLVSLKAGNAGLNLVAASQVIILDPFWNPYVEMQAVDRAHRIGQQKPVKVHRILVEKTVEDRIMELQERKRKLVDAALDEKASQGLGRLGQQELIFLFGADSGQDRVTAARPAPVYSAAHDSPSPGALGRSVYPIDRPSPPSWY